MNFPFTYKNLLLISLLLVILSCGDDEADPDTNGVSSANFNTSLTYGTMQDNDGNTYRSIEIGDQTWMAQNLRSTTFRNGEAIPEVTDDGAWVALTTSAQSAYEHTMDLDLLATHGRLYNWFAVTDPRNIAPEGWHVPTQQEWETLAAALGGANQAGGPLKEAGLDHWNAPNSEGSNSSGFTALGSGRREYTDGSFINRGFNAFWWTSSPYNPDYSWYFQVNYDMAGLNAANFHKQYGFAIRLVKD
jgi:uncharacterized protein (TIGR02145 family)